MLFLLELLECRCASSLATVALDYRLVELLFISLQVRYFLRIFILTSILIFLQILSTSVSQSMFHLLDLVLLLWYILVLVAHHVQAPILERHVLSDQLVVSIDGVKI